VKRGLGEIVRGPGKFEKSQEKPALENFPAKKGVPGWAAVPGNTHPLLTKTALLHDTHVYKAAVTDCQP
jgi:hypothetical protein